jgi:Nuclease-related domain
MVPDDARAWRLKRDDACALCALPLPRGTDGCWCPSTRQVFCRPCASGVALTRANASSAGASSVRIHQQRRAADARRQRERWGRLAPLVGVVQGPKQTTTAWAKGATGEQRLAAYLEKELGDTAALIHDRRIPGRKANIDHLIVGPSGVWVVDAKRYTGRVERRDVSGLFRSDLRVYVGGRDQTKLILKMPPQADAVRAALAAVPAYADTPVHTAICFTSSDWGLLNLGKPFLIDDVLITYPGALPDRIRTPQTLSPDRISRIAARLAADLPRARRTRARGLSRKWTEAVSRARSGPGARGEMACNSGSGFQRGSAWSANHGCRVTFWTGP